MVPNKMIVMNFLKWTAPVILIFGKPLNIIVLLKKKRIINGKNIELLALSVNTADNS